MEFKAFYFLLYFLLQSLAKGSDNLYLNLNENALDPELCDSQLEYIINEPRILMDLAESGLRIPKNVLEKKPLDFGNYQKCLAIDVVNDDIDIKGKYCSITLYYNQSLDTPEVSNWPKFSSKYNISEEATNRLRRIKLMQQQVVSIIDISRKIQNETAPGDSEVNLAVCIPKQCSTEQALSNLFVNFTALGLPYTENYCRFKNDKPWVAIDYAAMIVFAIIILLAIASTSYDLWHTLKLNSDPRSINPVYKAFSVYTNGRRLLTVSSSPDTLECVDGIRALSMIWIILLHSNNGCYILDPENAVEWYRSPSSIWLTAGNIAVDTFFLLSGTLLVYTVAKKMTGKELLKNLHFFYLNRYLRLFPILAVTILLQASLFHHVYDGPLWNRESAQVNKCRKYWWLTLLYVQNYIELDNNCLIHSWYLAIDMQLHILSPLVLFWVLYGKKRVAWTALATTLLGCLLGASIKNFLNQVPYKPDGVAKEDLLIVIHGGQDDPSWSSDNELLRYYSDFYMNTLTRAPPFVVGMVFGYFLHVYRLKEVYWAKVKVSMVWVCALLFISIATYLNRLEGLNLTKQALVDTFNRSIWAIGVSWMIFACVKGYGVGATKLSRYFILNITIGNSMDILIGPVNWFLSLKMWKLPSRLSYAMYIFHFPLLFILAHTNNEVSFFSVVAIVKTFCITTVIVFVISFVMTLLTEMPFSILTEKLILHSGKRNKKSVEEELAPTNVGKQEKRTVETSALISNKI